MTRAERTAITSLANQMRNQLDRLTAAAGLADREGSVENVGVISSEIILLRLSIKQLARIGTEG